MLRCCPEICLQGLRKTIKKLSDGSWMYVLGFEPRDFQNTNQQYKTLTRQGCSVITDKEIKILSRHNS